mmetsp:Transcript_3322/g.4099  ORF Transcript_3322/g.4099 Transcript_3322/m.4099 type:complete len:105 (-) Transcript_3322:116-430(-)
MLRYKKSEDCVTNDSVIINNKEIRFNQMENSQLMQSNQRIFRDKIQKTNKTDSRMDLYRVLNDISDSDSPSSQNAKMIPNKKDSSVFYKLTEQPSSVDLQLKQR